MLSCRVKVTDGRVKSKDNYPEALGSVLLALRKKDSAATEQQAEKVMYEMLEKNLIRPLDNPEKIAQAVNQYFEETNDEQSRLKSLEQQLQTAKRLGDSEEVKDLEKEIAELVNQSKTEGLTKDKSKGGNDESLSDLGMKRFKKKVGGDSKAKDKLVQRAKNNFKKRNAKK